MTQTDKNIEKIKAYCDARDIKYKTFTMACALEIIDKAEKR